MEEKLVCLYCKVSLPNNTLEHKCPLKYDNIVVVKTEETEEQDK